MGIIVVKGFQVSNTVGGVIGLFAGGDQGLTKVDKYLFADKSMSATTVLTAGDQYYNHGCVGDALTAYFVNGAFSTTATTKYAFADGSQSAGAVIAVNNSHRASTGNQTYGLIIGGFGPVISRIDRITYVGDTVASTTALSEAKYLSGASSSATEGYCVGGINGADIITTVSEKYQYGNQSRTTMASLTSSQRKHSMATAGDGVISLFAGGDNASNALNSVIRYTHSNDSKSTGAVLGLTRIQPAGTSDKVSAIISGGRNGGLKYAYTDEISFSSGGVSVGTVLTATNYSIAPGSTNHGGL